jgi:hypothetical protein
MGVLDRQDLKLLAALVQRQELHSTYTRAAEVVVALEPVDLAAEEGEPGILVAVVEEAILAIAAQVEEEEALL